MPFDQEQEITEEEAKAWQKEFPILDRVIHVANCSQSPQSRGVRAAINDYLDNWNTVGLDWEYWLEGVAEAKREFAKLINAQEDEVAVTTSVSSALAAILSSLPQSERSRLVLTEAEFPTVGHVCLAHRKRGYRVSYIPLQEGRIPLARYEQAIDGETLLAAVTFVYYLNGYKQDLAQIAKITRERGALLFVDAYQGLGTTHLDVKQLEIDILASGNLKYLLGPPGIAFIYVRRELHHQLEPSFTGWFGTKNPFAFDVTSLEYAPDASRFESGTPPILSAFAAKAGMALINQVGLSRIAKRIDKLSEFTINRARAYGLQVASPTDISVKGALTAIKVPDAQYMETQLKKRGVIASARGDVIRVAPHFFTTEADLDHVLAQIKEILKGG